MEAQNNNLTSLPEKWCVIATNNEEAKIMKPYANKMQNGDGWSIDNSQSYYLHIFNNSYQSGYRQKNKDFTEITFKQFERWVLNKPSKINYLWKLKIN